MPPHFDFSGSEQFPGISTDLALGLCRSGSSVWLSFGFCQFVESKRLFGYRNGPLEALCKPLYDVHLLVQDGDDDWAPDDDPEDVVMLVPMDADPVRQLRE